MAIISRINHSRYPVKDLSYVGEVRRDLKELACEAGFDSYKTEEIGIVVTELATNLAKHAIEGEIFATISSISGRDALELISIDHGPGINCFEEASKDGVSSKNTLGGGLGAINRLSDFSEHSSVKGRGTVIRCLFYTAEIKRSRANAEFSLEIGGISAPHPREKVSGDGIGLAVNDSQLSLLILDGLGHGQEASKAKEKALDVFVEQPFLSPKATVEKIHSNLISSRGVALAMTIIDLASDQVDFVGVGNITGRIYHRVDSEGCRSSCGVVGGRLPSLKNERYHFPKGSTLLFYSDGIETSANPKEAKALSASLMAASIFRDYGRKNDDATVVAVKDIRI